MKILHGIDITNIKRLEVSMKRGGARFRNRLFTSAEQKYCESKKMKAEHYAARFAAKEALMKAVEVDSKKRSLSFLDIEVKNRPSGKPYLTLSKPALAKLKLKKSSQVELSLTHEREYAMASVMIVIR